MQPTEHTPDEVLGLLMEGNARFIDGANAFITNYTHKRAQLTGGQNPVAAVLTCSDSRVPPQLIFDRTMGDLFIIRVAGGVLDDVGRASLQFAVEELHVPLIMVMGHSTCGAVKAAVDNQVHGYYKALTDLLTPALRNARHNHPQGDLWEEATKENSRLITKELTEKSSPLYPRLKTGHLKIQPAFYSLESGHVELFD